VRFTSTLRQDTSSVDGRVLEVNVVWGALSSASLRIQLP